MTGGCDGRHAIILAAGAGSRLRDCEPLKPLALVHGKPLLLHVLDTLAAAGARAATVVTGYAGEAVASLLGASPIPAVAVPNPRWADAPNGVSVLAAREMLAPGSFLSMADHLLSPALAERLAKGADRPLALAVDRRLGHPWVDEADVTRVRTLGNSIVAIGKRLAVYDSYDCGLFVAGPELAAALDATAMPSLSDGVALLARAGLAQAVDAGDAPWLDVDDARALAIARSCWRA
ncbi:MAG: NTP transferase domain-containing protein [Sandaracinobacteroides sp.]